MRFAIGLAVSLMVAACLGNPMGPRGALNVVGEGAGLDTTWVGAPGEPVPTAVRLRITDDAGHPVPGASLAWEALGRNAQVLTPASQSNSTGLATAGWILGTDAGEEQQLRVTVRTVNHELQVTLRARAVPHIVSQLRASIDTPAVLRVGDTLFVAVQAIDPFGNTFAAPEVALSVSDSTVAAVQGMFLVGKPRRGPAVVRAVSHGIQATFPLRVTQFVGSIVLRVDSLHLTSIGAGAALSYVVLDDRGRVIADTTAAITVLDTAVATASDGVVTSIGVGRTEVQVAIGDVVAAVPLRVRQQIASLGLPLDTVTFQALQDTTTIRPVAQDSLANVIAGPELVFELSDPHVVALDASATLRALAPGATVVRVRDVETGIADSAVVMVRQVPVSAGVLVREQDGFSFARAGDSIGAVWALDRNGYRLPFERFQLSFADSAAITVDASGVIRGMRSTVTRLSAVIDAFRIDSTLVVVLPVEVQTNRVPGFAIVGMPDTMFPGPPTAVRMPDSTVNLYFTGYAPDSTQDPPFSGDLHYAHSVDGVHFTYAGVALQRDRVYRSQGIENVFLVPRDDGLGCRLYAAAGASWWIWQTFSATSSTCDAPWTWEEEPAVPGVVENDYVRRGNGEGICVWQDSLGTWWMLMGTMSLEPQDDRVWTVGLYRGASQRQWEFVRTVFRPGPPGSGRERAVAGPSVVEFAQGLYRMFLMADDLGIGPDGGRQRIWSAVSRDRFSWTLEGVVLDFAIPGGGPAYPTVIGDLLYYQYRNPSAGGLYLSAGRIRQP